MARVEGWISVQHGVKSASSAATAPLHRSIPTPAPLLVSLIHCAWSSSFTVLPTLGWSSCPPLV